MCVLSMVMDHYDRLPDDYWRGRDFTTTLKPYFESEELRIAKEELELAKERISELEEAIEAARRVDELTDQPDCEDPAKMTLLERVRRIERELGLS